MANQLKITSHYKKLAWIVEAEVTADSDMEFPRDIFLWTLDSKGALDKFQAIGHIDQVAKYPLYDSNRTSNFGIHLVKHSYSRQEVTSEEDRDSVIEVLKRSFDILVEGFEEQFAPVEELYPETL